MVNYISTFKGSEIDATIAVVPVIQADLVGLDERVTAGTAAIRDVKHVASVAALRLLEGQYDGQVVELVGRGELIWRASSTEIDDDVRWFEVDGVLVGRWEFIRGQILSNMTIKIPMDYLDVQTAINSLHGRILPTQAAIINILIQAGHTVTTQTWCRNGDFSYFQISSEDPVVLCSLSSGANLFLTTTAKGPVINTVFNMQDTGQDAFALSSAGASQRINPSCGVTNAGRNGAQVFNGASLDAANCIMTNSKGRTLWASGGAVVNIQNSNLSGGNRDFATTAYTGAVTSRRASVVNAQGCNFSGSVGAALYAIRASALNVNDSVFNDIAGTAMLSQSGAVISAENITGVNMTRFATAEVGGKIYISNAVVSGVTARGIEATTGSEISGTNISVTGTFAGDYGVNCSDDSKVSIPESIVAGFLQPIRGFNMARVNARNCDLSDNTNRSTIDGGSEISAIGATTKDSVVAGTPIITDFNVATFNTQTLRGTVWAQSGT